MKKARYLLAFVCPLVILYLAYAIVGIYPYGSKTLFTGDLQGQYVDFYSYLHEMLHGNAGLAYTFSKVLGGTMIDMFSYYLSSPFNLIFFFFDASQMPLAIFLLSSVKIGCISLSMYWFIQHRSSSFSMLFFSVAYALSGWVVSYQFQLMWLDGLILLPLLIYCIERLQEINPVTYSALVMLALVTNYYIGYMLCGVCALYFIIFRLFLLEAKRPWKKELVVWIRFAWYSGLGGMMSAFLFLPTLFALRGGKMSGFSLKSLFDFRMRFPLWELPSQMLPFSFSLRQLQNDGLPLIYCGLLTCICCIGFFISKNRIKKKIGYILLLGVLICSMTFYGLYQAWHGFAHPAGFQTRFSFIYIFFIVYLGSMFWTDVVLHWRIPKIKIAVILLACMECMLNVVYEYKLLEFQDKAAYDTLYQSNYSLVREMKAAGENEIYRVAGGELNGGWMFGYPSVSSYTSCEKIAIREFVNELGLYSNGYWAQYSYVNTPDLLTALFGVKYFLLSDELKDNDYLQKIAEDTNMALYESDLALPLGFWVKEDILRLENQQDNPMEYLNSVWNSILTEQENDIIREIPTDDNVYFEADKCIIRVPGGEQVVLYVECEREYPVFDEAGQYAEIDARNPLVVFRDSEEKEYYLENISESDICSIKFYECNLEEAKKRIISQSNEALSAHVCMDSYSRIYIDVNNATGKEQYFLLTIPSERKAWKAQIADESIPLLEGLDHLMLLKLPEGTYQVTLQYVPRGLWAGIVISLMGVVLCMVSCFLNRRYRFTKS